MRKTVILIVLVLVLIGAGAYIYFYLQEEENENRLILYGNVDVRQVDISFRVPGQVETLYYEEGDYVQPGKLLAKLNRTPYTSQVGQAEANLQSAKTSYANAEVLLKRRQELIQIGGVSQEDIDNAQTSRDSLKANLEASTAAFAIAKDNFSYTEVYAPNAGVILSRVREPGSVVNAADPVYTLSLTDPVWIRAFVGEVDLGNVYYGMPAEIRVDTPNAPVYHGKVGFISPVSEFTPKTVETTQLRTDLVYRLRIYIDHPDALLKQGMPVTVTLRLQEKAHEKAHE